MNKVVWERAVLIIACLWLAGSGGERAQAAPETFYGLLPASSEVEGWLSEGAPRAFAGDGLFKYMDGGAEVYREYGFARLAVQEYRNGAGGSIVVEVFEMSRDASAYGIYTFKSAAQGKPMDLGFEGQLAEYYLNFWSGKYLVTVTGQEQDAETMAGVEGLGRAAASRVGRFGNRPDAAGFLPQKGMVSWTMKYVLGPIGLRNFSDFSAEDLSGWRECIKADYEGGESLFLFLFGENDEMTRALAHFRSVLAASQRYQGFQAGDGGRFSARDARGRALRLTSSGNALGISLGGRDWSLLEDAIRKAQ